MKIIISSLQVTTGSSKGHLHPAIEIGLALKNRGHEIALLPLPSKFAEEDVQQIKHSQFAILEPPELPTNILLSSAELAKLAKNPETTPLAFESFLIKPLHFLFEKLIQIIKNYHPQIIVYDLMVYGAPLAARLLNIKEIGYSAGLKLIAPPSLTKIYQTTFEKISPHIKTFLKNKKLSAQFHGLELLSLTKQMLFAHQELVWRPST